MGPLLSQWVEESFTNFEQGINWRSYVVCDVAYKNVNNWLWTPFIERQDANRIYIEIKFSMRDCNLFPGMALSCKETFSLLYYEFDGSAHKEPPPWEPESYKLIDRIAADEGRFTSNSEVIINTEIRSIPVTKKGVYFAFRDQGACLSVIAIKIYYMVCPNVINNFALFPETPTGKELTAIVPAEGQCVANAVQIDQPRLLCKGDGNWTLPSGGCKCMAGYEPVGLACKVCPPATFKPVTGDELCGPCPAHSSAPYRGSTECRCDHGFHRAPKDPKWLPCTQPPSAPRNLTANFVDQATVLLSWSGPTFTGGRNDTVYRVECEACSTAVSFFPSQRQLNITRVTVSNLSPGMTYRFQVFAENGASLHETGQSVDIAVTTESTGYISLVITEDGVGQQKYNKEKEIKYNDSAAKSIDTAPKSSSSDFGLIVGVCVAILVLLVVISSMVIPYLRRSANECKKKQPSDCDTLEYTRTGEVVPSLEHPPIVPTARFNSPFSAATPLFTHFSVVPSHICGPSHL
ncbi:Ephrin type-A receptor 4 [Halotydeus destructor]|nr:Ephrin type-A receptor 4 [Halotydeus destructor]